MKRVVTFFIALLLSAPAFAGQMKDDSIACKNKEPLDILTVLAAMGDIEGLNRTEQEFVDEKKCVRLAKGTEVSITKAKRVLAGDPKIRGRKAHHRVSYHMANVTAKGEPWVVHLMAIETRD